MDELTTLAGAGAAVLVRLMTTELWSQGRARIGRLFARDGDEEGAGTELEEARLDLERELAAGNEDATGEAEGMWRIRLRQVLRSDPDAVAQLRAILDEFTPQLPEQQGTVHNSITGGEQHGTVIQGRDFTNLTFGVPPRGNGTV